MKPRTKETLYLCSYCFLDHELGIAERHGQTGPLVTHRAVIAHEKIYWYNW